MDDTAGFVVAMCHEGTDWCVRIATAEEIADPEEETSTYAEAVEQAAAVAREMGTNWYDFSERTALDTAGVYERVRAQAEADHERYPQYTGHWDRERGWEVVTVTPLVVTKLGEAFQPGDVTIARVDEKGEWTAYSLRTKCDTLVLNEEVLRMERTLDRHEVNAAVGARHLDQERGIAVRGQAEEEVSMGN